MCVGPADDIEVYEFGVDNLVACLAKVKRIVSSRGRWYPQRADNVFIRSRGNAVLLLEQIVLHPDQHSRLNEELCNKRLLVLVEH